MDERDLERIAAQLGSRGASRIDVDRTAWAVLARLKTERVVRWWASPALLRIAAGVALTVGAGLFAYRAARTPERPAAVASPVLLQSLSRDELEEVLDSLAFEAPAFEHVAVGLHDLNDDQLRELLRNMEG